MSYYVRIGQSMWVMTVKPRMNHIRSGKLDVTALTVLVVLGVPGWCVAVEGPVAVDDDPYLWLEDIDGIAPVIGSASTTARRSGG